MTIIETERLILRNWREDDATVFHQLNSDETVMRYFPFRSSRAESAQKMQKWAKFFDERGFHYGAVEIKSTGEVAGLCGLEENYFPEASRHARLETGWRFIPKFWGKGFATEAALGWLQFAFETLSEESIIAFAFEENNSSTAVMKRIGMRQLEDATFDHPSISDEYAHLRRHVLYQITADQWRVQTGRGAGTG